MYKIRAIQLDMDTPAKSQCMEIEQRVALTAHICLLTLWITNMEVCFQNPIYSFVMPINKNSCIICNSVTRHILISKMSILHITGINAFDYFVNQDGKNLCKI